MKQLPSLVGQRFGKLVVIEQADTNSQGKRRWLCQCDCGNRSIVIGANLTRGTTRSCGCLRCRDLTGQHIGTLTVLERSDRFTAGNPPLPLWKCRCDCGQLTYKTTHTLTNPDMSMCRDCAVTYATTRARQSAGFISGTQISRIKDFSEASANASGIRGVYLDRKSGKYRARIKFQGKLYNLGSFATLEDAVKARRRGEEEYFGAFLQAQTNG